MSEQYRPRSRSVKILDKILYPVNNSDLSRLMTKPTKWMCTLQRLGSAWAFAPSDQSLLSTQLVAKNPSFLHVDMEDPDLADARADLSLRWAHMLFCCFCHFFMNTLHGS